ncbi:HtaA domain-containing protein [Streptomyces jumonjinensis]|uniref:HtaA domain-containing protein n=1 Tax=Streptomyces jumonjinensis TaxID=1945 RepID=UPI00379C94F2
MSTSRRTRLAAVAALTAVSMGAGVLTASVSVAAPQVAAAEAEAPAPKSGTARAGSPILLTGQAGWGFKASWLAYVNGLDGTVTPADGASKSAKGVVSYPVRHGSVDPEGRDADVRFSGSVTYSVPAHGITAITFANPRIVLADGAGTLYMDVRTELDGAAPTSATEVPFAKLKASADALNGSGVDWSGITAALTAQGAETFAFEGRPMYEPGTALDPVRVKGTVSVPALTVSQVSGLGAETSVTVTGSGYRPGRGVYIAQSIALPGTSFPSVFGNAAYVRKVDADGSFTTTLKVTETFTPSGGSTVDCRTTACFVTSFNSHDGADATWMPSRAQDVARAVHFGAVEVTGQPASRSVRSGATASFTAAADGADSVRWERSTDGGTTWSAVDGAESATLKVKASAALNDARYRAVFTNGTGSVTTESATLSVSAVPSRITGFDADPEPVAKGGRLTVDGTLQTAGTADDTWRPLAKKSVVVEFRAKGATAWSKAASDVTDSKGVFSAGVTAAKDGDWRARYEGTADQSAAVSRGDAVDVRLRTEISGFNAGPEPVRKGRSITVKGTLRTVMDGAWKGTPGQSVTVWFKADGAKEWTEQSRTRTDSKGAFSKGFTAKKDGSWKAVFAATPNRVGASSGSDRVDVR